MRKGRPWIGLGLLVALGSGCWLPVTPWETPETLDSRGFLVRDAIKTVRENPIPRNLRFSREVLNETPSATTSLLQVRQSLGPQMHQEHDVTLFVQSGIGRLTVGHKATKVSGGFVVTIPRGMPYAYVNQGSIPTVLLEVVSPPYSAEDVLKVKLPKPGEENRGP